MRFLAKWKRQMSVEGDERRRARRKPGSPPDVLKINTSFEDAVARVLRAPRPEEGVPREKKRNRRSKKKAEG